MRNHFLRASAKAPAPSGGYVLTDSAVNNTAASSHTFSSVDIGAAATGRLVVVSIGTDAGTSGRAVSSVTIGGANALLTAFATGVNIAAVAWLLLESGTTTDVVVTYSGGTVTDTQIHVGYVISTGNTFYPYDSYTATKTSYHTVSDITDVLGRSLVILSGTLNSAISTTPPDYGWTNITQQAIDVTDTTDDFHVTATAIVDGPSSLSWASTNQAYATSAGYLAVSIPLAYVAAIARPTSEANWAVGTVADVNEVTPDFSDYLADSTNTTLSISFGSLTIAATGLCLLRFYEAEYNQNSGAPSNTANAPVWNNGAIAGYSLFTSLNPTKGAWQLREYQFDASNISSGTITFSFTQVRAGGTSDRTGGAIAWMEFLYPPG